MIENEEVFVQEFVQKKRKFSYFGSNCLEIEEIETWAFYSWGRGGYY